MNATKRWFPAVVLLAVAVVGVLLFYQGISGDLAYARQKDRITAIRKELAEGSNPADEISRVFRMVAASVEPAVVHIYTTTKPKQRLRQREMPKFPWDFFDEQFGPFFRFEIPESAPRYGLGSGMIVDAEKGYILTNAHVVDKADVVEVILNDRRRCKAKLINKDTKSDLAVLQIKADRLHAVEFGDSDTLEVGDFVLAIGSPFGYQQTVTFGIVSAKGRQAGVLEYEDLIQTNAIINPGNSGGPLLNMRAQVVGVNTMIATRTGAFMGIGFAIPSRRVKELLPALISGKEIVRGYLGVAISSLADDPDMARSFGLDEARGVLIQDVAPGGPADEGGLKPDDIILEMDGKPVEDAPDLQDRIAMTKPGTKVTFKVWRDRKETTVKVTVGKQPPWFSTRGTLLREGGRWHGESESGRETATFEALGLTVHSLTDALAEKYDWTGQEAGLIVTEVEQGSEADRLGIQPGDLIVKVQGKPVKSPAEMKALVTDEALREGVRIAIKSKRYGRRNVLLRSE